MTWNWGVFFSVVAAVASVWGLTIMQGQLRVARNASGGRGVEVEARPESMPIISEGQTLPRDFLLTVKLIGPGVRHNMAVRLETFGKQRFRTDPIPVMTCATKKLEYRYNLSEAAALGSWWTVSWLDPFGDGVRSGYFRTPVMGGHLELWKLYRTYRIRLFLQKRFGYVRPVGRWNPVDPGKLAIGQGALGRAAPSVAASLPEALLNRVHPRFYRKAPWKRLEVNNARAAEAKKANAS